MKLIISLSQNLTEDGSSKVIDKELKEAEVNLRNCKLKYFQQQLLHSQLQDYLINQQVSDLEGCLNSVDSEFIQILQEMVSLAEIEEYVHHSSQDEVSLFGINKEFIQENNPYIKYIPSIQDKLIPEIEKGFSQKLDDVCQFYSNSYKDLPPKEIVDCMKKEISSIKNDKKMLKIDRYNREKQFWQFYKALLEGLSVLEKLISNHRLSAQKEKDKIKCEYQIAHCDTMCLKIKLLELQLKQETYTPDSVEALTSIKNHLQKSINDSNKDILQVTQALKSYECLGNSFDDIVAEYSSLLKDVDNKNWALDEFKKSLDSDVKII